MWHYRTLLRLVVLSLLLGLIPPAATPQAQAHSAAIAGSPAANAAAPPTSQPLPAQRIAPIESAPVPQPLAPPSSPPAHALSVASIPIPAGQVAARHASSGSQAPSASVLASGPLTVNAQANVFAAGQSTVGSPTGGGGVLPPSVSLPAGTGRILSFSSITGGVAWCTSCSLRGGDGDPVPPGPYFTYITPTTPAPPNTPSGVSGIKHLNAALFLVGVFLDDSTPKGPAPPVMAFSSAGISSTLRTDSALFTPVLNQTFFIGDGKTGTGTGTTQVFMVPDNATRLVLGFADAVNLGSGQGGQPSPAPPGWYSDNVGSLSVTYQVDTINFILPPGEVRNVTPCHCNPNVHTWKPVNTRTGNYWTRVTDLAVQSPGPALVWTRTFNSQAITETTNVIGYGWQHPFATHLITPSFELGRVIILSPEGNELRFDDLGNQRDYRPYPGVYSSLIQANGVFTQTLRDQQQLAFDAASGRLIRTRDAQGRQLNLTYDGSNQLTQITDAGDATRKLIVTYTSGRITSVSDGVRTVGYGYDTTNNNLTSVTDAIGQTTTYTYQTPANHLLTKITNALGQDVEQMSYDSATPPRVSTQTLQDGQQLQFSYLATSTTVTTTGPDGRSDVQRYDYASNNTLTAISNRTDPNQPQTTWSTSFDGSFSPSTLTDGNAHTTSISSTYNGLPVQTKDALGQSSYSFYDPVTSNLVTSIDAMGVSSLFNYDALNNLLSVTLGITTTSSIRATTVYTYSYLNASNVWTTLSQPLTAPLPKDSRLLEERSPDGVVTHYDYDASKAHQVVKMTVGYNTALKQETTYTYDSLGRVDSVTTAANNATIARKDTTTYNADNTIAQTIQNYKDGVFDPHKPDEDVITTYGYDTVGRQIWVKDALGHYDVTYYNAKGQVSLTIRNLTGFSGGTTLPANPPDYSPTLPDANIATSYGYDGLGRTVLVTETGILTGTFNTSTLQFSAATTRVTKTDYDTLSRPVTVTLNYRPGLPQTADSNIPLYTRYDGASNVITQTDALGRWTVTRYDVLNRPVKTIANYQDGLPLTGPRDADIVTTTDYDTVGRVKQQTENWVDGTFSATEPITDRVTLSLYDTLGRSTTTTLNYASGLTDPALNRSRTTAYDATTGRVTGQQDPLGRWVSQQYDVLGRVTKTIQNCVGGSPPASCTGSVTVDQNVATQSAYDTLNRTTIVTDALTFTTRTVYDGVGRTLKTIQHYQDGVYSSGAPDTDVITSYRYDALGRTLAVTDTLGKATSSTYNALGQTTSTTDQVGRVTLSGYDGSGTLRWTRRADGQITVYQVDGLGRTVATIVNYSNGQRDAGDKSDQDLISRTVYDAGGRRLQQIQRADPADVVTAFAYNNQDQLIGVTENAASGTCPKTPCNVVTTYQYDRVGNRTGITDANNHTRSFAYDAADEQKTATDALGHTTTWNYDNLGRRIGQIDPRGSDYNLTMGYDGMDRPTTTTAGSSATLATITNAYDALGRRTSLTDGSSATPTTFQYDALGRMTQVNAPNTGAINYTYDGRGLRTKVVYPSPNNTTFNYTYLNDGRLQQVTQGTGLTPVARYNYDAVGRVVQAVSNTSAALNSQLITNYRYDGADRLRALRSSEAGTTVGGYQYDTDRLGLRTTITETLPLSPTLSTTRIKTITFDGGSLTDAATGADSTLPNPTTLVLTTTGALKGGYSMVVPRIANSYLREDFTAASEVYVTLYLRVDALPSANTRLLQITNGSTGLGDLQLLTNGKLRMHNSGTTVGLDSTALTVGALYRVGIHQKQGSGTGVLEAFLASGDNQFTSAFAGSSTLTISLAASRVQVGATVSSNILAITADDITIDTAGFAQPSVNSLRASAAPAAATSGTAATTPTAIDPLTQQATGSESIGRMAAFARLPITFVPNAGQTDPSVRMHARGLHGNLFYGNGALTLALRPPTRDKTPAKPANPRRQKPKNIPPAVMQQRWIGANPTVAVTSTLKLPGRVNFLIDNDPTKWHTNLPTFADMLIRQLYDGIDQYYSGVDGQLKTTYVVAPGADPSRIRWRYLGADSVTVDTNGNLVVHLPAPASTLTDTEILSSTLTELAPVATQTINEREVAIPVHFVVGPDGSVGFALGTYDTTQPLIIDPSLVYGAFVGGSSNDIGQAIAVDSAGNSYITGYTYSSDFPTTNPALSSMIGGLEDVFVSKLNPTGSVLLYSTYLGGSRYDYAYGIAIDSTNSVYITGQTNSTDFPTVNPFQATSGGYDDAFVAKLNATGNTLVYSTYLGGNGVDGGQGIVVDSTGNAYITGSTGSTNFPTAPTTPLQATKNGGDDVFVAKLNATGNTLAYSTYLGGSSYEEGYGIAIDGNGNAYITGATPSSNFPTVNAFQATFGGTYDVFVAKVNATGTGLIYSTYLGGTSEDDGYAIAVDSTGNAYVTGATGSSFPTVNPIQANWAGGFDAFVAKLNATGNALVYSTYLGGTNYDYGYGIAVDSANNTYVTGTTESSNFPVANALQATFGGGINDAFVTKLNTAGSAFVYSTYLGGNDGDYSESIRVDSANNAYIVGETFSTNFPTTSTLQAIGDNGAVFVAKITESPVASAIGGSRTISQGYDGLQRLTGATENPGAAYTYAYDLAGNRTDQWLNGALIEHRTYNAANQMSGWSYDASGNLLSDGANTFTYDALNRPLTVAAFGQSRTNTYNGDGALVAQTANGVVTLYTQDLASPLSQILQTKVGSATPTDYIYGLNRLASLNGSTTTWYAQDALGSVRRTFNGASATPLGIVTYDPWGTPESGTVPTFGFTGELQDTTTGLVNLRARWYSTNQGKFTTVDPFAGDPARPYSQHQYAYGFSDPVLLMDPSGRVVATGDTGGYDPYCQDGSRRPANGQCQYEFVADAQKALAGGAGSSLADSTAQEYWNRLIHTETKLSDPSGVFDADKGQPGQEIFVPTDLGRGIAVQLPTKLGDDRTITTCPDDFLADYLTNTEGGTDFTKLPQGVKPSDLKGKSWRQVRDILKPLGAIRLPPSDPNYPNDKKYRWRDEATGAFWEVRFHVDTGAIRFGRLLADTNGDVILDQDEVDRLNALVNKSLRRGPGGKKASPKYSGRTTTWIDQRGWLYYGPHDKPVGNFTNIGHSLRGVPDPTTTPDEE